MDRKKYSCYGCAYIQIKEEKTICKYCVADDGERYLWDNSNSAKISIILDTKKTTYESCGICGYTPQSITDIMNFKPLRWWDPDDGYKYGALCLTCAHERLLMEPKVTDYAYKNKNMAMDVEVMCDLID